MQVFIWRNKKQQWPPRWFGTEKAICVNQSWPCWLTYICPLVFDEFKYVIAGGHMHIDLTTRRIISFITRAVLTLISSWGRNVIYSVLPGALRTLWESCIATYIACVRRNISKSIWYLFVSSQSNLYLALLSHYSAVIMGMMESQITSLSIVYSTICSGAYQRKHLSAAAMAFVRGIHRCPVNSPSKWPITPKMFPFDDVMYFANDNRVVKRLDCKSLQSPKTRRHLTTRKSITDLWSFIVAIKWTYRKQKACCLHRPS